MSNYALYRYLLMTLDPVHVGTGGYRLGRVDLSIIREPGTRIPKIPGTSFSGALRQYAAYRYNKIRCAGKGGVTEETQHCGWPTCPICYTFGYAKGEEGGHSGTVNLFDAHILLFPVHSMAGPVWASTKTRLESYGFQLNNANPTDTQAAMVGNWWKQPSLNLGWLMLEALKDATITEPSGSSFAQDTAWQTIKDCIVLVTEKVLSQVVNSNLEVRTSASIDPTTGAAETGALFTYEAIPRATWLVMDVVQDVYREEKFPITDKKCKIEVTNNDKGEKEKKYIDNAGDDLGEKWEQPIDLINSGFKLAELLGIGGMGTRGFGRVRSIGKGWNATPESLKEAGHA